MCVTKMDHPSRKGRRSPPESFTHHLTQARSDDEDSARRFLHNAASCLCTVHNRHDEVHQYEVGACRRSSCPPPRRRFVLSMLLRDRWHRPVRDAMFPGRCSCRRQCLLASISSLSKPFRGYLIPLFGRQQGSMNQCLSVPRSEVYCLIQKLLRFTEVAGRLRDEAKQEVSLRVPLVLPQAAVTDLLPVPDHPCRQVLELSPGPPVLVRDDRSPVGPVEDWTVHSWHPDVRKFGGETPEIGVLARRRRCDQAGPAPKSSTSWTSGRP